MRTIERLHAPESRGIAGHSMGGYGRDAGDETS
jgi:S-formylglutathione hydrolase FrmB